MTDQRSQMDLAIMNYLDKRGYKKAEVISQEDPISTFEKMASKLILQGDINISNYITFWNNHEKFPNYFNKSYKEFKEWVNKNLESNKVCSFHISYIS